MTAPLAVLFDLDGTLVDSAPDLAASANALRAWRGLPALPLERLRPHVGSGARGMLGEGLGLRPGDADYEALRVAFLADYAQRLLVHTTLFTEVPALLASLRQRGLRWGIVTNKALSLARPIQQALLPEAEALVGGDCTGQRKPHPAPLLEAARRLGCAPAQCLYVGDDPRDMQAARAAEMTGVAAGWGYLGVEAPITSWGPAAVLERPLQLLDWLGA
ncbi:HAD family hydrolase [Inhella sp.]|uniref:HAD family hydrolase n=1 Tax=Inhella sp. TaxID=1921806 RepID=UPI0035AF8096